MPTSDLLQVLTFTAAGFGENAYLVRALPHGPVAAIDPGADASSMVGHLEREGLQLEAILLTHAHLDHIEGVPELARRTGAPIYLHPGDRPLYDRAAEQAAWFGMRFDTPPAPTREWSDGDTFALGDRTFHVHHVPGHSPGHIMLHEPEAGVVFIGDVVFLGSIGRSDLPGGDFRQLMKSIRSRVLTLPDETVLYPGHGPATTVGHERVSNPFLVPQFGGGLA